MLRIRTQREMIELGGEEVEELRKRLQRSEAARPIEDTIAVATNASTSVTFTEQQKAALRTVLDGWLDEVGAEAMGGGAFALRNALGGEGEHSSS
jgi:hypothetical protein